MRVGCNNYGLGTWFQLSRLCSVMQFPEHIMIFPDTVHTLVRENLCRTLLRIQGPKLVFTLRQFQEGLRAMGLFRWAWAQGPYGSWDLGAVQMQLWFLGYMDWSFKSFSLTKSWVQNWVSTVRQRLSILYMDPKVASLNDKHEGWIPSTNWNSFKTCLLVKGPRS